MGEQQQGQEQRQQEQPAVGADSQRPADLNKDREIGSERDLREGKPGTGDQASEADEFERAPQPGLTPDS